jgi:hypothetical protein
VNALQKLRSVVEDIRANAEPLKLVDQWALAGRLIGRMPVDQSQAARVVSDRDVAGLDELVRSLESPAPAATQPAGELPAFSKSELDHALKAFRKQLRVARLADESKLGGRYTSGGKTSKIDAMQPPTEFPPEIWKALAADGRLKHTGQGFYAEP